jgi:putative pyoverdin transport system ATP-binding/permease protein
MTLLRFILRTCRGMMVLTTIAAVLSGACNAALIALVNTALHGSSYSQKVIIWAFVAMGLGKIGTNFMSQAMLARFSQGAIAELRRDLIRKILGVPLRNLERIGSARILVGLTDDVFNITQALLAIPIISVNLAILLGGAAYLGYLSWQILAGVVGMILLGAVGYRVVMYRAFLHLNLAREEEDKLFSSFRALTEGIKELKLHRKRRGEFFTRNIHATTEVYQRHNVAAELWFIGAQNWTHLLYFALIGLILFLAPKLGNISQATLTGYVITTLYLMGPLAGVMSSISLFGRASVALRKVQELGVCLSEQASEICALQGEETSPAFSKLEFRNVAHSYHREQYDSTFVLGPIDLTFQPGELVYLVGGNGSGKSTLAKIVTGLYVPESGEIRLNGVPVTDTNRDDYRQLFSCVFGDFYLFENLLGFDPGIDAQAREYLEKLHLNHKVSVVDGALSTTALSQGQRKRLALLTAYLEDRPFYVFDEWASDQDPYFKNIFYTELLPELKLRGKTVLVITHDDRFFHLADRLIKLDYGKLMVRGEVETPLTKKSKISEMVES